jgi:hypothetical protein
VDADEGMRVDAGAGIVGAALAELGDVGSGGEHPARPGEDQDARLGLEFRAELVERVDRRLADRIADRGPVERGDHAIREPLDPEDGSLGHTRSTMSAVPCPTPTHMVARP